MSDARIMEYMTVNEVREGFENTKTVIVPMGVIEQHGYHLPLNTDVFNCYEISKRVSKETGCFVAPPINYSFSGGELPGTFNINPSTLSLYLSDILKSLVNMGMKNIVVLLGHAGSENQVATENAIDMFMRLNPNINDVVFAFMPFTSLSKHVKDAFDDKDFHAGYFETSLMLYWHPELVRTNKITTDDEDLMNLFEKNQDAYQVKYKPVEHEFVCAYIKQNPRIEVGVMGNPHKASYEYGKEVCNDIVENTVKFIRFIEGRKR
jgi:creatinine amidohydrolase